MPVDQLAERARQYFRTVPWAKRADETDHDLAVQAEAPAKAGCIDVRRIAIGFDAVWIYEDLAGRHLSCHQLVSHRLTDHDDQIRGGKVRVFDLFRQRFMLERRAPVAAHPDLGAVVFEHKRNA